MPANKKIYILDTNVLLHDPNAIFSFEDTLVGIPAIVLEELDKFKKEGTERGRNAREVTRILDELRNQGSLREGVHLPNDGMLRVLFIDEKSSYTFPFKLRIEDNEILLTAVSLNKKGYDVTFISKDLNARVKADALGIASEDYIREYVSEHDFYKGWVRVTVPAVELKREVPQILNSMLKQNSLTYNQFVLAESQHNPHNYRVFRYLGGKRFKAVGDPEISWRLTARNAQQLMALDLLFDDEIKFVCLFGPAGTGKTFLTLLAGLHEVIVEDEFEKMLVSRPVVPLGRDIGFLPGTLEEKMHSWMLPVFDNMEHIVHAINIAKQMQKVGSEYACYKKEKKRCGHAREKVDDLLSLDELVFRGKLSMEAITFMRGRSIPYQFILIDEVQNLTPHEVKTLVTRVGTGSKIVLTGDPYQIDSPYLDFASNGLVIAGERFKGQKMFGSVYLEKSERSQLSQLAGDLL